MAGLFRISDWSARWFDPLPGHDLHGAALTEKHLYVLYAGLGACAGAVHEIYRYDLRAFEKLGEALPLLEGAHRAPDELPR